MGYIGSLTTYDTVVAASTTSIVGVAPSTASYVLTSNGASSLPTFQIAQGLKWSSTSSTTISLAAGNGYICTSSSAVTATLPTSSCPIGSTIAILVVGSGNVTIAQGTGQTQTIGAVTDTSGSGGSFANTSTGDSVTYVCTTAASGSAGAFYASSVIGNWSKT